MNLVDVNRFEFCCDGICVSSCSKVIQIKNLVVLDGSGSFTAYPARRTNRYNGTSFDCETEFANNFYGPHEWGFANTFWCTYICPCAIKKFKTRGRVGVRDLYVKFELDVFNVLKTTRTFVVTLSGFIYCICNMMNGRWHRKCFHWECEFHIAQRYIFLQQIVEHCLYLPFFLKRKVHAKELLECCRPGIA